MNNKGQTLVLFIIFLPIILFIFMSVYDLGSLKAYNNKIDNMVKTSISYSFSKSLSDDEIKKLIIENIDGINSNNIIIDRDNDCITITVNKKFKGIFNIIKFNDINISYIGTRDIDSIRIEKK